MQDATHHELDGQVLDGQMTLGECLELARLDSNTESLSPAHVIGRATLIARLMAYDVCTTCGYSERCHELDWQRPQVTCRSFTPRAHPVHTGPDTPAAA